MEEFSGSKSITTSEIPVTSVVIPVLNGEKYIRETMLSVLNQTLNSFELIVVNDGSTDNTGNVVEKVIAEFPDKAIRLISRENRGMCTSLNEGLAISRAKYFAYVGADDVWDSKKLEYQVEALEHSEHCAAFSDCWVIDSEGKIISRYGDQFPYHGGDIYQDLIWMRFQPASPTVLFRRDTLEAVGRFNESHIWEDRDLWIRIAREHTVAYVDKPLACYRVHGNNGSSSNLDNMYKYALQVLESSVSNDRSLIPMQKRLLASINAYHAAACFESLKLADGRRFALKALMKHPTNSMAWRTLLLSFLGKGIVRSVRRRRRSERQQSELLSNE